MRAVVRRDRPGDPRGPPRRRRRGAAAPAVRPTRHVGSATAGGRGPASLGVPEERLGGARAAGSAERCAHHPGPDVEGQQGAHLRRALARIVSVGGDTDTVGAIAGQLLGARWGLSAVPAAWRRILHGWPGGRTRDLVRLAVLTARRGATDDQGWPAARSLHAHYAADWPAEGRTVEVPGNEWLILGDVSTVAAADVDVVVSLCRLGPDDVPGGVEHLEIPLADHDDTPNPELVLADTADLLTTLRDEGRRVLLHCVRAESRTPAVAAAYLVRARGLPPAEAIARLAAALPRARIRQKFSDALTTLGTGDPS